MKRPIVWIAIGYISAIGVVSFYFQWDKLYGLLGCYLAMALILDKRVLPLLLAGGILGMTAMIPTLRTESVLKDHFGEIGQVKGLVTAVKPITGQFGYLEVEGSIILDGLDSISGRFEISTNSLEEVMTGDEITADGYLMLIDPMMVWGFPGKIPIQLTEIIHLEPQRSIKGWLLRFSGDLRQEIMARFPLSTASLIQAVAFGYGEDIPDQLDQGAKNASLSHVLVVSGQHLMIVASLLGYSRKKKTPMATLFILVGIWSFIALVGLTPSALRGGIMVTATLLLALLDIQIDSFEGVALAVMVIGFYRPELLFGYSLMLSVLAVTGISLFVPPLKRYFARYMQQEKIPPILRSLGSTVAVVFGAQLGVLPLLVFFNGRLSLWGLITNPLVILLIPVIIVLGILTGFLGIFMPILAGFPSFLLGLSATALERIILFFGGLPFGIIPVRERFGLILIFGILILLIIRELFTFPARSMKMILSVIGVVIIGSLVYYGMMPKGLEVVIVENRSAIYCYEGKAVVTGLSNGKDHKEHFKALKNALAYLSPKEVMLILPDPTGDVSSLFQRFPLTEVMGEENQTANQLARTGKIKNIAVQEEIQLGEYRISTSQTIDKDLLTQTDRVIPLFMPVEETVRYRVYK